MGINDGNGNGLAGLLGLFPQWEYKRIAVDESYLDERELDHFGSDGWELIGWRHEPQGLSSQHDQDADVDRTTGVQTIYVFKRPRSAK